MKTILHQLKTFGEAALFGVLFTCGIYGIGLIAISAEDPAPRAAEMLHRNLCEGASVTFDACKRVVAK